MNVLRKFTWGFLTVCLVVLLAALYSAPRALVNHSTVPTLGADPEYWSAVGLLHDFDYEMYPEAPDHPLKGADILRERGYPEEFVRTILSHASYTGVPRENDCARWLFAVDELSGFCMACAMVQPDRKIAQVKVKSVKKKLKKKDFAAKVNREEIAEGAGDLGLEQAEVIEHVLAALTEVADDLGL